MDDSSAADRFLKTASKSFVDLVNVNLHPTEPRMGLVTYSSDATTVSSLSYDFVALKNNIGGMSASGSTNCAQALYKARQVLQGNSRLTAVKAIVFMSDGVCNTSSGSTCSGVPIHRKRYARPTSRKPWAIPYIQSAWALAPIKTRLRQSQARWMISRMRPHRQN